MNQSKIAQFLEDLMFLDIGGDPYLSDDLFGNHHKELIGPFAPIIKPVTPQKVPSNNAYEP